MDQNSGHMDKSLKNIADKCPSKLLIKLNSNQRSHFQIERKRSYLENQNISKLFEYTENQCIFTERKRSYINGQT